MIEIMLVNSMTFRAILENMAVLGSPYASGKVLTAAEAAPFPTIKPIAGRSDARELLQVPSLTAIYRVP